MPAKVAKISDLKREMRTFNEVVKLATKAGKDLNVDEFDDWDSMDREASIAASPLRNSSVERPFRNLVELRRDA